MYSILIISGRSFLATSNALINCRNELIKLSFRISFGNMTLKMNIFNELIKLSFGNMTLKMNIFNICKQRRDDNNLQEVDLIEELVYDHFESTLSKTKFDEFEELQMIYFHEEIRDKKGTDNVVANYLSKSIINSTFNIPPIDDYFPDESLVS